MQTTFSQKFIVSNSAIFFVSSVATALKNLWDAPSVYINVTYVELSAIKKIAYYNWTPCIFLKMFFSNVLNLLISVCFIEYYSSF